MAIQVNTIDYGFCPITKCQWFTYVITGSNYNTTYAIIPNETPIPFEIGGIYEAFTTSGSSNSFYPILKVNTALRGIHITRQNDVFTVYIASKSGNNIYDHYKLYSYNNSLPTSEQLYVMYYIDNSGVTNKCGVIIVRKYANKSTISNGDIDRHQTQGLVGTITLGDFLLTYFGSQSYTDTINPYSTYTQVSLISGDVIQLYISGDSYYNEQPPAIASGVDISIIKSVDGSDPEPYVPPAPEDPNDEGEPSDEDGGDGDHDPQFDPIPIPNKPTQGASTAGFLTMYKLSQGHMQQFGEDMFASNVWEAIKLFFSNPIDFLVGIMLLPFEPAGGSSYKPKFGTISFARAYPTVANQYHDVDCGSIQITKYWGSFLDYAPYTKLQIWLPYIGYRDLDVDEVMGNTISVKYRCDCVTGDCVAFIYVGVVGEETGPQIPRVLAQFYGNCGVQIPFGSVTYDQAVMAGIEMLGTAANWGLSGGSAILDSESFAAYNVNAVNASKPEVQKGGGAGSTVGYMSIQKPYIIRKIARQNLPADYIKFKGYPSNISGKLADFEGFAKVDDIQLNDIPAMEPEREEIISLLKGGVLL